LSFRIPSIWANYWK